MGIRFQQGDWMTTVIQERFSSTKGVISSHCSTMPYLVTSDCMVDKTKVRTVDPPAEMRESQRSL